MEKKIIKVESDASVEHRKPQEDHKHTWGGKLMLANEAGTLATEVFVFDETCIGMRIQKKCDIAVSTAVCVGCGNGDVYVHAGHLHYYATDTVLASWCEACAQRENLGHPCDEIGGGCFGELSLDKHGFAVWFFNRSKS